MDQVSIVVLTRQCTGNNDVDVIGECEKEYNPLALYGFAGEVIKKAKQCGGKMIPWNKEYQQQKFCYSFRFGTEEGKKNFLRELS